MNEGLIRVREFADECGCTPQNIYLHLKNYAAELEGHTHKGRRGILLDGFAQDFIRQAMYPKELSTDNSVQKLQEEVAELRSALFKAGQQNLELAAKLAETEGARDRALVDAGQYQKLLRASEESEQAKEEELARAKTDMAAYAEEAQKARQELVDAHTAFEEDLTKKNNRIQELEAYAAAQKARADFFALPWIKRIGKKAPVVPELQED